MKYGVVAPNGELPVSKGLFEVHKEHCLVWGKNVDKQYRLSHNTYISENQIEKSHYEEKESIKIIDRLKPYLESSKPLIESKIHIRIKIENVLVDFYRDLIEALKSQKGVGVIVEHSPEFLKKHFGSQLWMHCSNSDEKIDEMIFLKSKGLLRDS